MAYSTLRYGSKGSEVSNLQQALKDAGYDLGSYGVDGQYGSYTQAAVKKYQQDNGLTVDGIAGSETLGKLYAAKSGTASGTTTSAASGTSSTQGTATSSGTTASTGTTTASSASSGTTSKSTSTYDPSTDADYQAALAKLQEASQNAPEYANSYEQQLQDLYDQIVNRESFSYDLNSDMLYQQYRDQYTTLGEQAMRDTIGQAAGLTGGYSSTYAESVGQQQYNAYLQKLNDIIPDLYSLALEQYNTEGDRLQNIYSMTADLADDEYDKYIDSYNQWLTNRSYYQDLADTQYERGYQSWEDSYNQWLTERNYYQDLADTQYERGYQDWEDAYTVKQSAFNQLYSLIAASGYSPTDEELEAAGMTREAANALIAAYQLGISDSGGSSGGGSYSSGSDDYGIDLADLALDYIDQADTSSSSSSGSSPMIVKSNASTSLVPGVSAVNTTQKLQGVDTDYIKSYSSSSTKKTTSSSTKKTTSSSSSSSSSSGLSTKATATLNTLKKQKSNGASTTKLNSLLKSRVSSGYLTRSEATTIAKKLGFTYSERSSSRSSSK